MEQVPTYLCYMINVIKESLITYVSYIKIVLSICFIFSLDTSLQGERVDSLLVEAMDLS